MIICNLISILRNHSVYIVTLTVRPAMFYFFKKKREYEIASKTKILVIPKQQFIHFSNNHVIWRQLVLISIKSNLAIYQMQTIAIILGLAITVYTLDIGGQINDIMNSIQNDIRNVQQSIVNQATGVFKQIENKTVGTVSNAIGTIQNFVNSTVSQVQTFVVKEVQVVEDKAQQLVNEVTNAAKSIISMIESQVQGIFSKITQFADFMCQNECTSFFNLPCFLIFGCVDKLKKFVLILVAPIFVIILLMFGCCLGLVNLKCLCKFLLFITGIYPLFMLIRYCCRKDQQEKDMKVKQQKVSTVKKDEEDKEQDEKDKEHKKQDKKDEDLKDKEK